MLTITLPEAKKLNLIEHLVFSNPSERIDTQWGVIPVKIWMRFEAERITQHLSGWGESRVVALVENNGKIALFVNDPNANRGN